MSQTLKNALLLGQTGAGKSTVAQALATHLGHVGIVFEASDKIEAHTQKPKSVTVGGIKVTDSPGLMDTEGRGKDMKNMELIVTTAKSDTGLHAAILVLNEANDRFDSALQDCLKLFVDSFGPEILARIAVVFTRAGAKTAVEAMHRVTAMAGVLRQLTGVPVDTFPVFQIDAGVDSDARFSPAYVAERKALNSRALDALVMWIRTQSPISTADFKIGEYAEAKRIREEQERAAEQKKRADAEAAARQAAEQRARDAAAAAAAEKARADAEAVARQAAEQRAREAEAAARSRRDNSTFLNHHGFKIGGKRIW